MIYETPAPVFSGFDGSHDGVVSVVEVFGGVLIFRRIAAADVTTAQTQAEVDPGIAHFQALLTSFCVRLHIMDLIEMGTLWHGVEMRGDGNLLHAVKESCGRSRSRPK